MDFDARNITINYDGGSVTMVIGNAKDLFGEDYTDVAGTPEAVTQTVRQHPRVRVIGGPSVQVGEHARTFNQWPTSNASNAGAGKVVYMTWADSEGSWTARVSGTMAAFADFLKEKSPKMVVFRTSRGKKYGPFIKETD